MNEDQPRADADDVEPTPKKRRSPLMRVLRWVVPIVVIGIVGYFFTVTLIRNWGDLVEQDISFHWTWILAVVLFAAAVITTGTAWRRLLRRLEPSARVSWTEAVVLQAASWLLKYVPGQVGAVVNKVVWAGRKGISRTVVLISFVYENVLMQIASIVPSTIILLVALGTQIFGDNPATLTLPLLLLIPFALVMWKPFFHRAVSIPARRVLKQEVPEQYFLSTGGTAASLAEFLVPRIVNAVGFVVLAGSIVEVSPAEWLPFGAAYVLAGAIGVLAVFVPSGIGVREAVIVLVLGQYMPTAQAIVIAILARVLSTAADALLAAFYAILRRSIPKEIRP